MLKSFKYRIYPTNKQKILLAKHFGCARWIYNWALQEKLKAWNEQGSSLSGFDLQARLPGMKDNESTAWLAEVSAQSLRGSLFNLDKAYTRFFRQQSDFPRFKKKDGRQSFSNAQGNRINWDTKRLHILKFSEGIAVSLSRRFEGKIKTATVSRNPSGKYHVSILVETSDQKPLPSADTESCAIGLDFGLKTLVVTSDGQRFGSPFAFKNHLKKLKRLQRLHRRTKIGSKRREKSRLRLARLHERISNIRNDSLHKLSHHLVCENQATTLCIEDLSVADMLERRKDSSKNLRRSIGDAGWGELRRQLEYKCKWYGKNLRVIGRFEPSSKICNECGVVKHDLKLSDREWTCQCGVRHDRDINAAINIKKMAFQKQNTSSKPICRRKTALPKDIGKIRLVEDRVSGSMKREVLI